MFSVVLLSHNGVKKIFFIDSQNKGYLLIRFPKRGSNNYHNLVHVYPLVVIIANPPLLEGRTIQTKEGYVI